MIRETFPNAVIAGGALRDLKMGKPIKDIDIFLSDTTEEQIDAFLVAQNANQIYAIREMRCYGAFSNKEVHRVLTYPKLVGEYDVEFIALDTQFENVLNRFDFGLCQIMYDGTNVITTSEFVTDVSSKKLTLLRCDNPDQYNRSMKRATRMLEKYPDHTLDTSRFPEFASCTSSSTF